MAGAPRRIRGGDGRVSLPAYAAVIPARSGRMEVRRGVWLDGARSAPASRATEAARWLSLQMDHQFHRLRVFTLTWPFRRDLDIESSGLSPGGTSSPILREKIALSVSTTDSFFRSTLIGRP